MRCLVTGASGHLGSYLTRHLIAEGNDVYALVRPQSCLWRLSEVQDKIHLIHADLSNIGSAADAIVQMAPRTVYHLAWSGITSNHHNDPEQVTRNVIGGLELFKAAQSAGCRCWIGIGSQAEYGPRAGIISEETTARPITTYGVAKFALGLLTEKLCDLAGMRYIWLRLFATYGPKDDERHMIPTVIQTLLSRAQPYLTPGEQLWDYLHVEDAAEAIYRAASTEGVQGVYNLGSGKAYSVRSIVEQIRNTIDESLPLTFGTIPYCDNQTMHLEADIRRFQRATAWAPRITLADGLRNTVDWYRMHQSRCNSSISCSSEGIR